MLITVAEKKSFFKELKLRCIFYVLKALLNGKLFDKLFRKVTKNKLVYGIVNRVLYRKLMQKLL